MAVNYKKGFRTYENEKFDKKVTVVGDEDDDQPDYEEIAEYVDKPSEEKKNQNKYTDWNERGTSKSRNSYSKKKFWKNRNENTKDIDLQLPTKQKLVDVKVVSRKWRTACAVSAFVCAVLMSALGVLLGLMLSTKASPCEYVQCLHNGNCSVSGDKAICNCHDGFYGLKCEGTPCVNYSCDNGGTCFLDEFQPKCACKNGFTGDNCTITPCSRSPCEHTGTCSVIASSFSCACLNGFTGLQCESTPCVSYSCYNGGTCFLDQLQPKCACKNGFTGDQCTTTPCSRSPCEHAGTCSVIGLGSSCACLNGFTGLQCESTPCVSYSCFNGGTCFLDKFQPKCACKNGFTGDHCIITPRNPSGNCSVRGSNVACICLNGFAGLHCEIYVADFENSLGSMFIQDLDDDYNWKVHSNSTDSTKTGPSTAYKGDFYLYFETSSPVKVGSVARLVSRDFMFESSGCLKFHYHMYGSDMGTLNVYQGSRQVWMKTGNQGNQWHLAELNLQANSFNCSKIYFEAVRGTSYKSDIAIDDVEVHPSRC